MHDGTGDSKGREAQRNNNFGALRLCFSVLVLFSHSYPLTGNIKSEPLTLFTAGTLDFGGVSVDGFFLISGCLITQSWSRSRSPADFIIRRFLRIYPGYWITLLFSLMIGTIASTPDSLVYLKNVYYHNDQLLRDILFLGGGVQDQPPVFKSNLFPNSVNGSLWTLQTEFLCYALTLVLGVFGIAGGKRASLISFTLCYAIFALNIVHIPGTEYKLLSRFLTFFFLGAAVSSGVFGPPRLTVLYSLICCGLVAAATQSRTTTALVYPFVFAYLLFGIAYARFTPGVTLFAKHDISYGVYLYAFPVQQTIVRFLGTSNPVELFLTALPITAVLAYASWRLVEQPMLALAKRFSANSPSTTSKALFH